LTTYRKRTKNETEGNEGTRKGKGRNEQRLGMEAIKKTSKNGINKSSICIGEY
jgi:hypothetical protein